MKKNQNNIQIEKIIIYFLFNGFYEFPLALSTIFGNRVSLAPPIFTEYWPINFEFHIFLWLFQFLLIILILKKEKNVLKLKVIYGYLMSILFFIVHIYTIVIINKGLPLKVLMTDMLFIVPSLSVPLLAAYTSYHFVKKRLSNE